MRIIGGAYSGRPLTAPGGRTTRPTADRVRESLFNILTHLDDFSFDDARVIDLFSGSGALGFEAMSRGAAFCLFVETDAAARGAIRENVELLGLFGSTRIHRRSATALGPKPAGVGPSFSLAFLDPPYAMDLVRPALEILDKGDWLAPNALVVVEQAKGEAANFPDRFHLTDQRAYGAAQISILRYAH